MAASVSVVGLGRMGSALAGRLVDAGHDVTVWNRTPEKAAGFANVGASPVETAAGAQIVITMLADPDAVRDVVFGTGLDKALRPDAVFVDMSTIGLRAAKRLHEVISRATLDAPVGGGVKQAESGELVVLAGGERTVLDRAGGVLQVLGEIVHCGPAGSGQAAKLCFNAVLAVVMSGIGEAVALGEKLGLDTDLVLDVLRRGGARPMVERKGPMIASHDYTTSFALALMKKDAGLVREAVRDADAWAPLVSLAAEVYDRAEREGLGEGDYSGVTELFRRS